MELEPPAEDVLEDTSSSELSLSLSDMLVVSASGLLMLDATVTRIEEVDYLHSTCSGNLFCHTRLIPPFIHPTACLSCTYSTTLVPIHQQCHTTV